MRPLLWGLRWLLRPLLARRTGRSRQGMLGEPKRVTPAANQPESSASPDLAALNRQTESLRSAGKYAEALPAAREALGLTITQDGRDSLAAAHALTVVAELYFQLQNYEEAEPLFRRALEIAQSAGAEQSEIAAARANLAKLHKAQESSRAAAPQEHRDNADPNAGRIAPRDFKAESSEPNEEATSRGKSHRSATRPRDLASPPNWDGSRAQAAPSAWDVVPIFYGTDRQQVPNPKRVSYNELRAHRLELGRALVTIPKNHQVPEIERPWALHLFYFDVTLYEAAEDPKEHFTLQEIKTLSKAEFLSLARERLAASTRFKDHAFVFVHGYYTPFDFALYRAAQIANDLHFDGAPFMYSWPSGGAISSYGWDRESAEGARTYLRQYLDMVIKETGAKSISIIAHSMGNIALLDVLRDMNAAKPRGVAISQIILAAPDVSVDDFAELAKGIKGLAGGVTLYASANDRALQISRGIWGSYRAGDVSPSGPTLAAGVETIDVTAASTDVFALNHSGYAENNDLLKDVGALIEKGVHPPEARSEKIRTVVSPKGGYWRYLP